MNKNNPQSTFIVFLELLTQILTWTGIFGMIFLLSNDLWADTNTETKKPFSFNHQDDDDDEDEEDDEYVPIHNPHADQKGNAHTISSGGLPTEVPHPIRTKDGISTGGSPSNGVIRPTGKLLTPLHVDTETAIGNNDIVTDFNFPDASIMVIAQTLGKLTGKNFILDKDVKGNITIISNSPITVADAWRAFLTALDINGFAIIPSGKYLRIAKQRDAREKQLKTYIGDKSPDTDALITRVFPLRYISAEEVARTFRNFMPTNARIIPYEQTNTVFVIDTGSNITKLAHMLDILDVEGYDAGIVVVPVKYASAADLSKLIDTLIPGTQSSGAGSSSIARSTTGGKFNARRTKEGGIVNTIIADERTNTLIVHANAKGADQVRELVAKLDQKPSLSTGGGKAHVVYLQFAEAEQIANTLNNFSSQATNMSKPTSTTSGQSTGINPVTNTLFEGSVKVSPDKSTNALVITASTTDFSTVKRVINQLDVPRDQVYVEVIILEISMNKGFNFSANVAYTPPNSPSPIGSLPDPSILTDFFAKNFSNLNGGLIGIPLGSTTTQTIGSTTVQVPSVLGIVRALQANSNANILATPQITALDNSEATFESAEKIPVGSAIAVQGVGAQVSVTKESVALSITIKPQINKLTNFIKMDVSAKISNVSNTNVPAELKGRSFGSIERSAKTSVIVANSDTIVLGGLIRDSIEKTVNKVPLLGDIPILGWLFKSDVEKVSKSNLLIFMTPHIIKQYDKVRAILDKKLKERDEFIENYAEGSDSLRTYRDNMIRGLPDVEPLRKQLNAPQTSSEELTEMSAALPLGHPQIPIVNLPEKEVAQTPLKPSEIPQAPMQQVPPPTPISPPAEN